MGDLEIWKMWLGTLFMHWQKEFSVSKIVTKQKNEGIFCSER